MSKTYLGIDPGLRGSFSLVDSTGSIIGYKVMPVIGSKKKDNLVDAAAYLGLAGDCYE